MDMLNGDVKKVYFRFLFASFGSALITSVYSIVDCIMVGQYEGENGTAALAVFMPVWNMIFAFTILFAVGGAVMFSAMRGKGEKRLADEYFTASLIGVGFITAAVWLVIAFCDRPLLLLFGASEEDGPGSTLSIARNYIRWMKYMLPAFTVSHFLATFVRNDGRPALAAAAVLCGGVFNIIGDYLLVFTADMGAEGAGLATCIGQILSCIILITHFFTKRCTLRLAFPHRFLRLTAAVVSTGFSTFIVDFAVGICSTLFNNQIRNILGNSALSVYGVIINISMVVQSFSYGVGQAAQPIISQNYGAGKGERVKKSLIYSLSTVAVLGAIVTLVTVLLHKYLLLAFTFPGEEAAALAPFAMRSYFTAFLLMPFNIFVTYYLQAVMKPVASAVVSALRSVALSAAFVFIFPAVFGVNSIWWVMPATELCTAAVAAAVMFRMGKKPSAAG